MSDHPIGSFEWAKQIAARPPKLNDDARYMLARAQVRLALGCLSGEPNRAMAICALEDALLHLREAGSHDIHGEPLRNTDRQP